METPPFDLATEWIEFVKCQLPDTAPEIQHMMMKRAFYAGAITVYSAIIMDDGHKLSKEEFNSMMDGMSREFERYGVLVRAGAA